MNILDTIRKTIERRGLFPPGARVVAGVSGGADSVALLRILHALGTPLTVAHLNHRLRADESDADEAFVRELADELQLPVCVKSVDVKALADSGGLSIEMAARRARHAFFEAFEGATIALAHHAGDQAETFILRLARGAGAEGLCGMDYIQRIGSLRLARPLLDIPRTEILAWLRAGGWTWREDASNTDENFLRNRVRHTILPLLEQELNPNIRETILRTMDILREEHAWMDDMLEGVTPEEAAALPKAARRRVLRKWLFSQGADDADFDTVETLLEMMRKADGSRIVELNDDQRVVMEYGRPRFEDRRARPAEPSWILTVEKGHGWKRDRTGTVGTLPAEASFDAVKVGGSAIEARAIRPGDRIEPLGMDGSRKLQDILTDLKVPQARRKAIPVVLCRGEIIWLPGYRIARGWAVRNAEAQSVHVRIEQSPPR